MHVPGVIGTTKIFGQSRTNDQQQLNPYQSDPKSFGMQKPTEKVDPIMLALERESRGFDPSVFLQRGNLAIPEQRRWVITQAKFVNKFEEVLGGMIMTDSSIEFKADLTQTLRLPHDHYEMTIDYLDIVSVSRLQIPNEGAVFNSDEFYVKNYKFCYMIQVEVSAINGLTIVAPKFKSEQVGWEPSEEGATVSASEKALITRSNIPLTNLFFKVRFSCINFVS